MASEFIAIEGAKQIAFDISKLPEEAQDRAADEVNKYLLNIFKLYPSYKYVPFKKAYGGFFSDKQRKYVMAKISEGVIKPGVSQRTQSLAKGWKIIGDGKDSIIANEEKHAAHVMGDGEQARMPKLIGWKTIGKIVEEKQSKIDEKATAGVKKAIKKLGLG